MALCQCPGRLDPGFLATGVVCRPDAVGEAAAPRRSRMGSWTEPDERFDAWGDPLPHEYRLFDRAGRVVWVRDDAFLAQDELGRGRWHGVILDITDRKLVEAELERRAAQQSAVARLGEHALERVPIADLMQEAVNTVLEVLSVDGALVAEAMPDGESFEFRASCGWPELEAGSASSADGTRSQAEYTVLSGRARGRPRLGNRGPF